jgi:hypothetical protein
MVTQTKLWTLDFPCQILDSRLEVPPWARGSRLWNLDAKLWALNSRI